MNVSDDRSPAFSSGKTDLKPIAEALIGHQDRTEIGRVDDLAGQIGLEPDIGRRHLDLQLDGFRLDQTRAKDKDESSCEYPRAFSEQGSSLNGYFPKIQAELIQAWALCPFSSKNISSTTRHVKNI
jgi:hypothetical protein